MSTLTPAQQRLLAAIRTVAAASRYGTAASFEVRRVTGERPPPADAAALVAAGHVTEAVRAAKGGTGTFRVWTPAAAAGAAGAAELTDDDFRLLNRLEEEEARRINFGAVETATTPADLSDWTGLPAAEVTAAFGRLAARHYLLWLDAGTVRSRFAELARELRAVKQRFGPDDAGRWPYLVRSLHARTEPRRKPTRDHDLAPVLDRLKVTLAVEPAAAAVLDAVAGALRAVWGIAPADPVRVAGFQARALERLLPAYLGAGAADTFVVTADTGAGKTEAALLPLLAGAALDRRAGRRGVKAVFVYPRVRLAYNQAGRLARYLAAFAAQPGGVALTLGLQSKDVPQASDRPATYDPRGRLVPWPAAGGGFAFPLFACPRCDGGLRLEPGGGTGGHDRLLCGCGWRFDGWAGSKRRVQAEPPDLFLPVAESLHRWLHDPRAGRVFGDVPGFAPPRALVADEVHLYSHVQGTQTGYVLRRLLARAELNGGWGRPLAVGMSATLGRPAEVWGELVGRAGVVGLAPDEAETVEAPRGREHFYLVQPEVQSRAADVAGASTTIQAVLCLAHGMRRRPGDRGGYRGVVFFDSLDQVRQLHGDYRSAEEHLGLAALRTTRFPAAAACCGAPGGCDRFRDGECWFFAAAGPGDPARPNDPYQVAAGDAGPVGARPGRPLAVMDRPVTAAAGGRVDADIRRADLVFATSSLEVGFDDPDMILVYQHYAPANRASFAQRKGRGGRGVDDRPVTGCTLSIYSPEDNWYFRHPDLLLGRGGYDIPLNPGNHFVRRGQAVAAVLDAVARHCAATKRGLPAATAGNLAAVQELAAAAGDGLLAAALGPGALANLRVGSGAKLLAVAAAGGDPARQAADSWREFLRWVPRRLFDAINLPELRVEYEPDAGGLRADPLDVSLAFGTCSPGDATRRFAGRLVHWVPPPVGASGPMLPAAAGHEWCDLDLLSPAARRAVGNTEAALDRHLRGQLPDEAGGRLAAGPLYHRLLRPTTVRLGVLGRFGPGGWVPRWFWSAAAGRAVEADDPAGVPADAQPVHHKSSSRLLGFSLVEADGGRRRPLPGLDRLALDLVVYQGGPQGTAATGLRVGRVFWGVDVTLRVGDRGQDEVQTAHTFTHPADAGPALSGYRIDPEGVRLTPDPDGLAAFLAAEAAALRAEPATARGFWGRLFRYRLTAGLAARGVTAAAAGQLADLLVTANAHPALQARLQGQRAGFDAAGCLALLADARAAHLGSHPLHTERRVARLRPVVGADWFPGVLRASLDGLGRPAVFAGYLRSVLLHGLLLSLRTLMVVHGRGDGRQVGGHARLPLQFGDRADDHLTVFELGDHGDGTTRTFVRHLDEALAGWRRGELGDCPYAAEAAVVDRLFAAAPARLADWRALDPADPETLPRVGRELTGTAAVRPDHLQALGRALFQTEAVGGERFARFEVGREFRAVRDDLAGGRQPDVWEVVSAAVRSAAGGAPRTPTLTRLLAAYAGLAPAADDSLSAEARLADQLYRLGVGVCGDGCPACLHQPSPLMADELAAAAVSRRVLADYREFVLAPTTARVGGPADLPAAPGVTRLLVTPAANDGLAAELAAAGWEGRGYDPLLGAVVWVFGKANRRPHSGS